MLGATCTAAAALFAPAAGAETFGQIGTAWGSPGTGNGQFRNPGLFGVDPEDGSVYAGDIAGATGTSYRIQKFTGSGEFKASALIPRFDDAPEEKKIVAMHGLAVDHEKGRFYLVDGCRVASGASACKATGSLFSARRILVYKTAPEGEKLVPAGAPLSLPEGAEELYTPQSIAVDPSNHDIVILAEDAAKHIVIQRISSSGTLGSRFVDTANTLKPGTGREATSIAVGPDGTTYTLTGAPNSEGAKFTRAWELPPNLSGVSEVPGFAAAAEGEGWFRGLQAVKSSVTIGSPQVAISPDGNTLYWKENQTTSSEEGPGSVLVRAYSLSGQKTTTIFGGGSSGSCEITTSNAGIGATGSKLVVFDYGPLAESGKEPGYGVHVLTFGPGGSGCPTIAAKFKINGTEGNEVSVEQGTTVSFDASGSQLNQAFREELIWKFGDGAEEKVPFTVEPGSGIEIEAKPTVTHKYTASGKFTVRLEIKLKESSFGNPAPVEHIAVVHGGLPSFPLKVEKPGTGSGTVKSSPAGIDCGGDCEETYEEGKKVTLTAAAEEGSTFAGWSGGGCSGTATTCEVTMPAAETKVKATFTLQQHLLKVTKTGTGAASSTVTSTPAGISCGATCEVSFDHNTAVTLSAVSGTGFEPAQWTGCDSIVGSNECKVTLSAAKEVTAKFDLIPGQFPLKVKKAGSGAGTVASVAPGIDCGSTCQASFAENAVVVLKGTSDAGSKAVVWTGCDSIVGSDECKVAMTAVREITATFDAIPLPPPPAEESKPPAPGGGSPTPPPAETKPKLTAKQKALAKCKKLKGKAKAQCVKKANSIGKPKGKGAKHRSRR